MEDRFKEIYFKLHLRIVRIAYYILKDMDEAEDVAQDVFLKLWEKGNKWENDIRSIEAYLVRIARNMTIDQLKQKQDHDRQQITLREHTIYLSDHQSTHIDSLRRGLEKAVAQLSPQCRLIFALSRFEGLTNDEISTYLEISKRTVETQISTALKRFRSDLKACFLGELSLVFLSTQFL